MRTIYFVICSLILTSSFASEDLLKKNLEKQMEKEKIYQKEQKFYQGKDFKLDSFEVDDNSLKNIPEQPDYNDDFNMDHTYD